jgi:hypothetical protein
MSRTPEQTLDDILELLRLIYKEMTKDALHNEEKTPRSIGIRPG